MYQKDAIPRCIQHYNFEILLIIDKNLLQFNIEFAIMQLSIADKMSEVMVGRKNNVE